MGQPGSPAHLEHQNPKTCSWPCSLLPQSHRGSVRMGFVFETNPIENNIENKVREDTVWAWGASVKPLGACRASRSDAPAGQSNFTRLPEGTPRSVPPVICTSVTCCGTPVTCLRCVAFRMGGKNIPKYKSCILLQKLIPIIT